MTVAIRLLGWAPVVTGMVPPLFLRQRDLARWVPLLETLHLAVVDRKFENQIGELRSPEEQAFNMDQRNYRLSGRNYRELSARRQRHLKFPTAGRCIFARHLS